MNNNLLQQIQKEINAEAKIDKIINSKLNFFIKSTPNLKQVYNQKDCDMILIFNRDDLSNYESIYVDDPKEEFNFSNRKTIFYFRNKNIHDRKKHQINLVINIPNTTNFYSSYTRNTNYYLNPPNLLPNTSKFITELTFEKSILILSPPFNKSNKTPFFLIIKA